MIKLTVNPDNQPKVFIFKDPLILIGEGASDAVQINLPGKGLHLHHIKIFEKEGEYFVINQANDPFTTLNNSPFWKKRLAPLDILQVQDTVIRIDEIGQEISVEKPAVKPLKKEEEPVKISETLMYAEYEEGEPEKQEIRAPQEPKAHRKKTHAADIIPFQRAKLSPLKFITLATLTVLLFSSLIVVEIFFRGKTNNVKEELLAAESLADYAMALSYARVYHIAPQKQNWTDPQFLRNSLVDLLSTTSLPCGTLDSQGQFSNCPYILRFYTNTDFTRFLLIAQPSPTLSQWLIPKDTLIVDSSLMTIRKTTDLKTLNRLLTYPRPLDGTNGNELLEEIKKAAIIPLNNIAIGTGKKEFAPPNALSKIKPGSENLIYNAPRYHQFGGTLLQKMQAAAKSSRGSYETTIFQNELDALSKMPNLVLYSTKGVQDTVAEFQQFKKFLTQVRSASFLSAYLIFSPSKEIINTHLMIDGEYPKAQEEIVEAVQVKAAKEPRFKPPKQTTAESIIRKVGKEANQRFATLLHNLEVILNDTIEKDRIYLPPSFFQLLSEYEVQKTLFREELLADIQKVKKKDPSLTEDELEKLLRQWGLLEMYQSPISLGERWMALARLKSRSYIGRNIEESRGITKNNEEWKNNPLSFIITPRYSS